MKKDKLLAFTLIELTIAMLISAIVLGVAFRLLDKFTKLFGQQQKEKMAMYERDLLPSLLRRDFVQADSILHVSSALALHDKSGVILYTFTDTMVLRKQYALRIDTFRVNSEQWEVNYVQSNNRESNKVVQFAWDIVRDEQKIRLYFNKSYAATELMQL